MPTLHVLRHAKSSWPLGVPDERRPLNDRGRRDAPVAGQLLAERGVIDIALVSPAQRTRETFALVAAELPTAPEVLIDERIYAAGLGSLMDLLSEVDDDVDHVLLVGHNPGMEMLAWHLAAPDEGSDYDSMMSKYPTSGLARIELPVRWGQLPDVSGPGAEPVGRLVSFDVPRG